MPPASSPPITRPASDPTLSPPGGIGRGGPPRGPPAAGAHLGQRSRKGSGIRTAQAETGPPGAKNRDVPRNSSATAARATYAPPLRGIMAAFRLLGGGSSL